MCRLSEPMVISDKCIRTNDPHKGNKLWGGFIRGAMCF